MATFTCPVDTAGDPPVLPVGDPAQTAASYRLMRYYRSRPAGRNVYVYKAGSISATTFGRVTEVDPAASYDASGNLSSTGWQDIQVVFWGGHAPQSIDAAMVTVLTNAGYGAYIT